MKFLIHYLARTPLSPLHFDIVSSSPVSAELIPSLRDALARDATTKTGRMFDATEIVIANIIPIPDK